MIGFELAATGFVVETVLRWPMLRAGFGREASGEMKGLFNRIFAGQKIDERASDYTLVAARTLNQAAAASAETLEELARQEISGRDWLEASRSETNSPPLFLSVGPSDIQENTP